MQDLKKEILYHHEEFNRFVLEAGIKDTNSVQDFQRK